MNSTLCQNENALINDSGFDPTVNETDDWDKEIESSVDDSDDTSILIQSLNVRQPQRPLEDTENPNAKAAEHNGIAGKSGSKCREVEETRLNSSDATDGDMLGMFKCSIQHHSRIHAQRRARRPHCVRDCFIDRRTRIEQWLCAH